MSNVMNINRILVVRNDSTTSWEKSNYILIKGEIGIGWLETAEEQKPITKVGNGIDTWINLPQSEYVLQENLKLTHSFGRHQIENGSVDAGGIGMTISEWIKDALIERKDPIITEPTFIIKNIASYTDTGTLEIGSNINEIVWKTETTPGNYEYGAYEDMDNKIPNSPMLYAISFNVDDGQNSGSYVTPDGSFDPKYRIVSNQAIKYGDFSALCYWDDATNFAADNLGENSGKKLQQGEIKLTRELFVTGYREGCFYGGISEDITVDTIRKLSTTGKEYKAGKFDFNISPGATKIVIAFPADKNGPTSIYNVSVNAEMLVGDNFTITQMDVPGANGYEPIAYKVLVYEPAKAYVNSTNIRVTLG